MKDWLKDEDVEKYKCFMKDLIKTIESKAIITTMKRMKKDKETNRTFNITYNIYNNEIRKRKIVQFNK